MRDPPVSAPPSGGYIILAAMTRGLLAAARAERLETGELLARAGLTRAQLDDPDGFVPFDRHMALRAAISERLGFENGGLRAGSAMYGEPGSVLSYAVRRSGDLRRAVERFCRFVSSSSDGLRLDCAPEGDGLRLNAELGPGLWELGHPSEALLAAWVSIGRIATGRRWLPLRVEFRHAARGPSDEHEGFFGCPVLFGAPSTTLLLGPPVLALPIVAAPHPLDGLGAGLEQRWAAHLPAERRAPARDLCRALADGPIDPRVFPRELRLEAARVLRASQAAFEVAFLLGFDSVAEVIAL